MPESRVSILQFINDNFGSPSDPKITGDLLSQGLIKLLNNLVSLENDKGLIGLKEHDTSVSYELGDTVVKDGIIYQSNKPINGVFNVLDWDNLFELYANIQNAISQGIQPYDNGLVYDQNDQVTYNLRIFEYTNISSSSGNAPLETNGTVNSNWAEVSESLADSYTPNTPSDWNVVPQLQVEALDELADRLTQDELSLTIKINSDISGIANAQQVGNIVFLPTEADYLALTPDPSIYYIYPNV